MVKFSRGTREHWLGYVSITEVPANLHFKKLNSAIDIDGDGQINLPELDITVARLRSPSLEEE